MTGFFVWKNGEKLKIEEAYRETFLETVNRRTNGSYYFVYSNDTKELKIKMKERSLLPIPNFQKFADQMAKKAA